MDPLEQLQQLRQEVEQRSDELAQLIQSRAALVGKIAAEKMALGLPARDPDRERLLIDRVVARHPGPVPPERLRLLLEAVLEAGVEASRSSAGTPGARALD